MKEIKINKKKFYCGLFLIVLGILTPSFITEDTFRILSNISKVSGFQDMDLILSTGFSLIVMNFVRALPHYVGAYILVDSIEQSKNQKRVLLLKYILIWFVIYIVYVLVDIIYGIKYDFSLPAIITIFGVILLDYLNMYHISLVNRIVVLIQLIFAAQWLDLIPALTRYNIGKGELSIVFKNYLVLFEIDEFWTILSVVVIIVFLAFSTFLTKIFNAENTMRKLNLEIVEAEKKIHEQQMESLELRTYREIQSLAHDLKTPLTTISGLSSLIELMTTDSKLMEYESKIRESINRLNGMINDLVHEEPTNVLGIDELFSRVFSNTKAHFPELDIKYIKSLTKDKVYIIGNEIRMYRAIMNLIENSIDAMENAVKKIMTIRLTDDKEYLFIEIIDTGLGINEESLEKIWDIGYSESNSTGLGLSFVKRVVEVHNGSIYFESLNIGTKVTLKLNLWSEDDGNEYFGN